MSLEKEIADLADAINSNTIALHANTMALKLANGEAPDDDTLYATVTEPAKTEKAKPEKKAQAAATKAVDTPPTAEVAETAPAPKADSSDAKPASKGPKADDDSPINFQEEISAPIVAMCKAGHRKTALAILDKYGAANASSLDKRHYVAVRADIAVALAEQAEDMA